MWFFYHDRNAESSGSTNPEMEQADNLANSHRVCMNGDLADRSIIPVGETIRIADWPPVGRRLAIWEGSFP